MNIRPTQEQVEAATHVLGDYVTTDGLAALLPSGVTIQRSSGVWRVTVPMRDAYGHAAWGEEWTTHTSLRLAMFNMIACRGDLP